MITRLLIAFEDLLGSLIAPQVVPHWSESRCLLQENNQAEAQRKKCSNADHPDIHGHYRQAKVTHLHHHHYHCQLSSLHRQSFEITRSISNTNARMHAFFGHNNFHFRQSDQNLTRLSKGDPNKAPLVVEGEPSVRRAEVNENFQR